jgi:acyl-CoA reductase-like NAD-dependent aldehyde dehydrogenase
MTEESGKPVAESLVADVAMALEGARFLSRIARRALESRSVRSQTLAAWRKTIVTHYEPYGVVAVVSPWNYPFFFPAMHAMTALVAGNAVVLKPSEHTPRSVDHIERLLRAAGVPPDVFIVLHGDGRTGAGLVNASVDKVFFTGSERTGRSIAVACAPRFVPVSLELGGSDAAIVLEDAEMATAASGILWSRFTNAGQTCVAVKRVIAVGRAYDELLPRLVHGVRNLVVSGDATTPESAADVGPVVTAQQRVLIMEQLDEAIAQGATVLARQEPRSNPPREGGGNAVDRQAPAVLLGDVTPTMRVWHEETFGPVLVIARASTEAEAIALANGTRYGLSASVWTRSRVRGARIAAQLQSGTAAINDAVITAGLPEIPHGGVKASGVGRIHGVEGLMECVRTRTVVDDALPALRQPWWFGYGAATVTGLDAYLRLSHGAGWFERLSGIPGTIRLMFRPERPL